MILSKAIPVRLVGFEVRRRLGIGRFITDSILHAEESRSLTMVLRAYIPGVSRLLATRSADGPPSDRCGVDVYLNGLRTVGDLSSFKARDVDAVEFYTASTAPGEYRRAGTFCPVLLLWVIR